MRFDLLISECNTVFIINGKTVEKEYIRAGVLVCVNTTHSVAKFSFQGQDLTLLIPDGCIDPAQITKTANLDLPILNGNEQIRISRPR